MAKLPKWLAYPVDRDGEQPDVLAREAWAYYAAKFHGRGHLQPVLDETGLLSLCRALANWTRCRATAKRARRPDRKRVLYKVARELYWHGFLLHLAQYDLEWQPGEPVDLPPGFGPAPRYRMPQVADVPEDLEGGRAAVAAWKFWAAKLQTRRLEIDRDQLRQVAEAYGLYRELRTGKTYAALYPSAAEPQVVVRWAFESYRLAVGLLDRQFLTRGPVEMPPDAAPRRPSASKERSR